MKSLIIFVGLLSITLGFPVGSPLHTRERFGHQLGYGYGPVYPFHHPFPQPDRYNDFTPQIYIRDHARPSIPKQVTPKPRVTSPQRLTTSMVTPRDLCRPTRGDGLNDDQMPVVMYVDPKDFIFTGPDGPLFPDQSGSNNQPVFVLVPGAFLSASGDGQVRQNPTQNTNGLRAPDLLRDTGLNRKQKA